MYIYYVKLHVRTFLIKVNVQTVAKTLLNVLFHNTFGYSMLTMKHT